MRGRCCDAWTKMIANATEQGDEQAVKVITPHENGNGLFRREGRAGSREGACPRAAPRPGGSPDDVQWPDAP